MYQQIGEFKVQVLDGGNNALIRQGKHTNYFYNIVSGGEGLKYGFEEIEVNWKSFQGVVRFIDGIQKKSKTGQYAPCDYNRQTEINETGTYL